MTPEMTDALAAMLEAVQAAIDAEAIPAEAEALQAMADAVEACVTAAPDMPECAALVDALVGMATAMTTEEA